MLEFKVKDILLAKQGALSIEWASKHMPVLNQIRRQFEKEKPLANTTIGACLHVTKETAVLVEALAAGGAEVTLCGSNPLSTQDEVAAALAEKGINVYAWRGETTEEYYWCVNKVINHAPLITLDDGADLVGMLHKKRIDALENVKGGTVFKKPAKVGWKCRNCGHVMEGFEGAPDVCPVCAHAQAHFELWCENY